LFTELGTKVKRTDVIKVPAKSLWSLWKGKVYVLLNKPKDWCNYFRMIPQARPYSYGLSERCNAKKEFILLERLDRNTTGGIVAYKMR